MKKTLPMKKTLTALLATLFIVSAPQLAWAEDPTPAPSPTTVSVEDLQKRFDEVNKKAEETNKRLADATAAYETGQAELVKAKAEAKKAEAVAIKAEEDAEAAKKIVGDFARSSYINPVPNETVVTSITRGEGPTEAMRGAEYLERIGQNNAQALDAAKKALEAAKEARVTATRLAEEATVKEKQLAQNLKTIQTEAEAASQELQQAMLELDQAKLVEATLSGDPALFAAIKDGTLCQRVEVGVLPTKPEWGGFSNGLIPAEALCEIRPGQALRWDAAAAFRALDAAYTAHFGKEICVGDTYRDYESQVATFAAKPTLAATPGNSNHGWGLAIDLCDGMNVFDSEAYKWFSENANQYGWFNPSWAVQGGSKPEAWHWQFGDFE